MNVSGATNVGPTAPTGSALLLLARQALTREVEQQRNDDDGDGMRVLAEKADYVTERRTIRVDELEKAKNCVSVLRNNVDQARIQSEPKLHASVRTENLAAMEAKRRALVDEILQGTSRIEVLRGQLEEAVGKCDKAREALQKAKTEDDARLSFQAYLVDTFIKVTDTRITSTRDDVRVKGVISKKYEHDVVPFDVDSTHMSQFDLVNHLWSLVTNTAAAVAR